MQQEIRLYFVFGKVPDSGSKFHVWRNYELQKIATHSDVISLNVIDDYLNLTLKSVSMLKWASEYCSNAKYLVKMDDDIYLNMTNLFKVLDTFDKYNVTSSVYGRVKEPHLVPTNGTYYNLFHTDESVYPLDTFPAFVHGFFYILTNDKTQDIMRRFELPTTPLIRMEDLYITGIVRILENITLLDSGDSVLEECLFLPATSFTSWVHPTVQEGWCRLIGLTDMTDK